MDNQPQESTSVAKAQQKQWFYATKPTPGTIFMRTFLPWQVWRFVRINLKMITIIRRSHRSHSHPHAE